MNSFSESTLTPNLHDQWVEAIARDRYGAYQATYVVGTNPGSVKRAWVSQAGGPRSYPDIVVFSPTSTDVWTGERSGPLVSFAEVETAESVTVNELPQWREYRAVGRFTLYVPGGWGRVA